jgi:hypothetical protein
MTSVSVRDGAAERASARPVADGVSVRQFVREDFDFLNLGLLDK